MTTEDVFIAMLAGEALPDQLGFHALFQNPIHQFANAFTRQKQRRNPDAC